MFRRLHSAFDGCIGGRLCVGPLVPEVTNAIASAQTARLPGAGRKAVITSSLVMSPSARLWATRLRPFVALGPARTSFRKAFASICIACS